MAIWSLPPLNDTEIDLSHQVGISPLIANILTRRGITQADQAVGFLDPGYYQPASPEDLPGMEKAVTRIRQAIDNGERIGVWGDFDVDGQTATTILVSALRDFGAQVIYHIPVRADESHGMNIQNLHTFIEKGVSLVLTCDTGISSHEAIDYAQSRGIQVIVSDHHDLPPQLPAAFAVINPRLLPSAHPLSTLSGSGVAYKLAEALYHRSSRAGEETQYLDLAALGIIADLVELRADTRYLAQIGIAALRKTQRKGLLALLELTGTNPQFINETHISFIIAPRLNAQGRLDDANEMVEFLSTSDEGRAHILATRLEALNAQRKLITQQILSAALAQIENNLALLNSSSLILSHPSWSAGVIGIVASQLASRYHRPVVLISRPEHSVARGSARSIEGCDITQALQGCADLLINFGGHPMAAGFTIQPENIPLFSSLFDKKIHAQLGGVLPAQYLEIDAWLNLEDLTPDVVSELERLAPFGPGNRTIVLADKNLQIDSIKPIGRDKEHYLITVQKENGSNYRVIWWQAASYPLPQGKFDLAYTARFSTYNGVPGIQIEWVDVNQNETEPKEALKPSKAMEDYRSHPYPFKTLQTLLEQHPSAEIWAEAEDHHKVNGKNRWEITPNPCLVIWSTPPSFHDLQALIDRVNPQTIFFFAISTALDDPEVFLKKLAGFVKYSITHQNGQVNLERLASATCQKITTVKKGLEWLTAKGFIRIITPELINIVQIQSNGVPDPEREKIIFQQVKLLLDETSAFREFIRTTDLHLLSL